MISSGIWIRMTWGTTTTRHDPDLCTGGVLAAANAGDTDTYTCTFAANVPAGAPGSNMYVDVVTVVETI